MNHLTSKILNANGQFLGALWTRPMKTRKGVNAIVTKTVRTVVTAGITYDNREVVKEARANGDAPATNAGLPWGVWENFPHTITHKGARYVRLYPVRNADGSPRACKVVYRVNGKSASRDEVATLCPSSEFSSGSATECYTLNEANLRSVKFGGVFTRANAKRSFVKVAAEVATV